MEACLIKIGLCGPDGKRPGELIKGVLTTLACGIGNNVTCEDTTRARVRIPDMED
jgi:hypothetical protein